MMALYILLLIFIYSCTGLITGCTSVKESAKGFLGVSTKKLEESRNTAVIKIFKNDYFTCYTNTLGALKNMGSYVYAQDIKTHMIALYVSEEDTSPVGIFFREIDARSTQVEVASPSTYAKEFVSGKLFTALGKK